MSDNCAIKTAFLFDYSVASNAFSHAVVSLHQQAETVKRAEYEQLYKITEEARGKAESARLTVEHHASSHGC